MMVITKERPNGRMDIVIVLGDINIERIKQHDPAEIQWPQIPGSTRLLPATIAVGYATAAEQQRILDLVNQGKKEEAVAIVTSGFTFRPDLGDHDRGPEKIGG